MKYLWVLLVVLAVPLLVWGVWHLYWQTKFVLSERKMSEQVSVPAQQRETLPTELTTDFDPSENSGVYGVEEVEQASGQVRLVYLWPDEVVRKKITTTIACPAWDNKIFDRGAKAPRVVTRETLLLVMEATPKAQLMFYGKCNDVSCGTIDRGCQLVITAEKQNETN